jgi:hypothetical protein
MDYKDWKLSLIEVICLDSKVDDDSRIDEILSVINGDYDTEYEAGISPEDAWEAIKSDWD